MNVYIQVCTCTCTHYMYIVQKRKKNLDINTCAHHNIKFFNTTASMAKMNINLLLPVHVYGGF